MQNKLHLYNTLTRKKESFIPLEPPFVGMYVCGPTVYSDAHLGHARPAVIFDVLYRYLLHLEYKVRYIRNITDVGHLEHDADEGEDKIAQRARLEQLEPMEVVQRYTNSYHHNMHQLNVKDPGIEPRATGHIIEQQQLVKKLLENGYAYESNGSVYFDVEKYSREHDYGKLSGRKLEDLMEHTRELKGRQEKKNGFDFALWKKAEPVHIMRWPSEWSEGFPGWHLECSVMSAKYLGEQFDIHGGGMDLMFPHHECEMAQSVAAHGKEGPKYWVHNNMITIKGQKMSKSLGNFITLDEMFNGTHQLLSKAFSPMTIRFFMLQAHYRSTVDFSNEALEAAEKGLERLMNGVRLIDELTASGTSSVDVEALENKCYDAMNDDLNTPVLLSHLFDGVKTINAINDGNEQVTETGIATLRKMYHAFVFDVLGLTCDEQQAVDEQDKVKQLADTILNIRLEAKQNKDFATADKIRDRLKALGMEIKDKQGGFDWEWK